MDERNVTSPGNRASCRVDGAVPTMHEKPFAVAFAQNQREEVRELAVAGALARDAGMKQTTYLAIPIQEVGKRTGPSSQGDLRAGDGIGEDGDPMNTLQAGAQHGVAVAMVNMQGSKGSAIVEESAETSFTLNAMHGHDVHAVAFQLSGDRDDPGVSVSDESAFTIPANPMSDRAQAVAFKASHYTRDKDGAPSDVMPPLSADADKGDQDPLVLTMAVRGRGDARDLEIRGDGTANALLTPNGGRDGIGVGAVAFDVAGTLKACGEKSGTANGAEEISRLVATGFEPRYYTRDNKTGGAPSDVAVLKADAAKAGDSAPHVAYGAAPTLTASNDPSRSPQSSEVTNQVAAVQAATMQVRRLTPRECERLQGFPDDFTAITFRGKPAADGPRYRALGNSMAVPVMRWIGKRIAEVDALEVEDPSGGRSSAS